MQAWARRTLRRLALAAGVLSSAFASAACEGDPALPQHLADGAPAEVLDIAFEGVDVPVIATKVGSPGTTPPSACPSLSHAVDRVGATGASRTWVASAGRVLRACDWTAGSAWCGFAFARRRQMTRLDPRLTLTCRADNGEPLGFLWITPEPGASYVIVAGRGYAEAYAVIRGAPVRVTSESVDLETSSATVRLSEHARDGRLLRARRVEAHVSG